MTPAQASPGELILLPVLKAQRGPHGGLVLTQKYLDGAAEFARFWPGRVTSLIEVNDERTSDMDHVEVMPGKGDVALEERPVAPADLAARLSGAAVVLAFLSPFEARVTDLCRKIGVPLVFTSEYSPRTECQIIDAEVGNPLLRVRRKLWVRKAERIRRAMLRLASGIQCSGTPTYELYRDRTPEALLFFDNRVRGDAVIRPEALVAKSAGILSGAPLRLVFGGRLIAMKGVLELPRVAQELSRIGVDYTLDIFGSGPLEAALSAQIRALGVQDRVALRGVLDFATGWVPQLRDRTDLFLCCHPQGDPSSTYPEVMSCGVPIAGYGNEAFMGIVRHSDAGWAVPTGDAPGLARVVQRLDRARGDLSAAAGRARTFADAHVFEKTFARRAEHLIRASQRRPN